MKRKLFAAILAACLVATMAVPALADDNTTNNTLNSTTPTGSTTVTYTQAQSYTVTIPSEITLQPYNASTNTTTLTVSASNVVIDYGKVLKVTVSSGNVWKVVDKVNTSSTDTWAYTLKKSEITLDNSTNNEVLSVAAGTATGSQELTAQLSQAITKSGTYEDILTFTVSVTDAT